MLTWRAGHVLDLSDAESDFFRSLELYAKRLVTVLLGLKAYGRLCGLAHSCRKLSVTRS